MLFLDGVTRDTDCQLPILDVPTTFGKPVVSKIYYDSLFELIKNNNVTIYIRAKYHETSDLMHAVEDFRTANANFSDKLIITSSRAPLQDVLDSINPSIVLVKPLSSTYLFSRELGYPSYFYLPKHLKNPK